MTPWSCWAAAPQNEAVDTADQDGAAQMTLDP